MCLGSGGSGEKDVILSGLLSDTPKSLNKPKSMWGCEERGLSIEVLCLTSVKQEK